METHGLDTPERICFYEQDYYCLSNFSSFEVMAWGRSFKTAEHLYHFLKFKVTAPPIAELIASATSAHDAFRYAQALKAWREPKWDEAKYQIMVEILIFKTKQHPYVRRKLLDSGDRELVENSWRDDYWGWGPNKDGQNMLGKAWMQIRSQIRAEAEERL